MVQASILWTEIGYQRSRTIFGTDFLMALRRGGNDGLILGKARIRQGFGLRHRKVILYILISGVCALTTYEKNCLVFNF